MGSQPGPGIIEDRGRGRAPRRRSDAGGGGGGGLPAKPGARGVFRVLRVAGGARIGVGLRVQRLSRHTRTTSVSGCGGARIGLACGFEARRGAGLARASRPYEQSSAAGFPIRIPARRAHPLQQPGGRPRRGGATPFPPTGLLLPNTAMFEQKPPCRRSVLRPPAAFDAVRTVETCPNPRSRRFF